MKDFVEHLRTTFSFSERPARNRDLDTGVCMCC